MGNSIKVGERRYTRLEGRDAVRDFLRRAGEERWTSLALLGPDVPLTYARHLVTTGFPAEAVAFAVLDLGLITDLVALHSLRSLGIVDQGIGEPRGVSENLCKLTSRAT
jgi:hypothetical protein